MAGEARADGRGAETVGTLNPAEAKSAGKIVDLRQLSRTPAEPPRPVAKRAVLDELVQVARRAQRLKRDQALYPDALPDQSLPDNPLPGHPLPGHPLPDEPLGVQSRPLRPAPAAAPAVSRDGRDQAVFWNVWLEHREHLRRQSLRLMAGNRADAEDALSAAMLRASQKFADYADSIVNERAWLTRLLHNACMDVYRGHKRQARWVPDASLGEEAPDPLPQIVSENDRTPEEIAVGRETLQQLERQIAALPPNLRLPFVMRFLQNRSYDEIAGRLELTNCAVRKRIQLARERLRSKIER